MISGTNRAGATDHASKGIAPWPYKHLLRGGWAVFGPGSYVVVWGCRQSLVGAPKTPEHRAKISAALKGRSKTPEQISAYRKTRAAKRVLGDLHPEHLRALARQKFLDLHPDPPWICIFCSDPVTVRNGWSSESLNVHHADEDLTNISDENLKPSHHGCHQRHHMLGNDHRRR